jgi:rod shape-determining protein MreD
VSPALAARLAALVLGAVLLEIVAVSQVSIVGGIADLTPLVVLSAGLLCGSLVGAAMGFTMGLILDLALVQTLGLSSLVLLVVGYWAGRLREVRDPQGPLVPILAGAAFTFAAEAGYSIFQFLLGVDAPVSLLLVQQIVITTLVNTLLALPVYALVKRILEPALPQDPRRRRRRAYTTGGLSPLQRPSERLGPIPRTSR